VSRYDLAVVVIIIRDILLIIIMLLVKGVLTRCILS